MYPYYKIIVYGNAREVESWATYYRTLDIPFAITRKERLHGERHPEQKVYALWRIGQEISQEFAINPPNSEPIDGEIVETFGGFEKYQDSQIKGGQNEAGNNQD